MRTRVDDRRGSITAGFAHRVAFWIGVCVSLTCVGVLIGWLVDLDIAKSVLIGRARMSPQTAIGLAIAGAALAIRATYAQAGARAAATNFGIVAAAGVCVAVGTAALCNEALNLGLSYDPFGFDDPSFVAPATAFDFVLTGCALWLADSRRFFHLFQVLALGAALVAWLGLAGQVSGGIQLPVYADMAVHTALAFVLLSIGLLCLRPDGGLVSLLMSNDAGGRVLWLLVLAPPLPLVMELVERLAMSTRIFGTADLEPVFAILDTLLLAALIWVLAYQLRRLDLRRDAAEAARLENENRLRLFVDYAPAAIAMLDRNLHYVAVSRRWLADYRLTASNILGRSHYEVFPEVPDRWRDIHKRCLDGAVESHDAEPFPRADGSVDWVRWEIRPWQATSGEISGIIIFSEVVTERIHATERIERLNRVYAMLSQINSLIVRVQDTTALFDEACRIAVEVGKFGVAWIGQVHRDTSSLVPSARAGLRVDDPLMTSTPLPGKDEDTVTISTRAVREKSAVFVNELAGSEFEGHARYEEILARGYHAVIALPLVVDGFVTGCFSMWSTEADVFDEEELKLLREIAHDVSFALQYLTKKEELDYISYYDVLTGLPNRSLFLDRIGQELRSRARNRMGLALLILDVERFGIVNESLGRHAGDELLRNIAKRLKDACDEDDALARIGPNGFAVALHDMPDSGNIAAEVEHRFMDCFRDPYTIAGTELRIAAKVGVALFPSDGKNTDALFRNAEAALKQAKKSGSRYVYYSAEMNAQAARSLSLETRLRKAVEAQEFVLFYQPKVRLSDSKPCGLEALIRWRNPDSGLVAPGEFIPILEETGLIVEVGYWALRQALEDHRTWSDRGCEVPRVAVNVSARQLQREDFMTSVINLLELPGADGESLELEITESLIMRDIEHSHRALSILRGMGVHVAMDDFGTGYSSLSYLARLPVDKIKIDRSFIAGMTGNALDRTVVSTIITLAHSFGFPVIAEGVEEVEQARALHRLGCDEAQGFLFSAPVPAAEVVELLRGHHGRFDVVGGP